MGVLIFYSIVVIFLIGFLYVGFKDDIDDLFDFILDDLDKNKKFREFRNKININFKNFWK